MRNAHLLLCGLLLGAVGSLKAQDSRERTYYYEILSPQHEAKPLVEGFATEKVKERLDRGLTAVPAVDGKSIYLSWRLLEQDGPDVSFYLYRSLNGKTQCLTSSPLTATCDFVDKSPVNGKATYWVCSLDKKKKVIDTSPKLKVDPSLLHNYRSIKLNRNVKAGKIAVADLYGDWREEIVTALPGEICIYTTNIPAKDRRITLMQDGIYRSYVAHRSMGYPQAPVPSYYLGE